MRNRGDALWTDVTVRARTESASRIAVVDLTVSYTRRMEGRLLANFEQLSKSIHYSKTSRSEFRLVLEVVL